MASVTPLLRAHERAGARMTSFAGWRLPVQFASSLEEIDAVRTGAGVFDVSHMTVTDFAGAGARTLLRRLLSNDVDTLRAPGHGRYACLLNEAGGIVDDLIVFRRAGGAAPAFRIVSNAATRARVRGFFAGQAQALRDVEIAPQDDLAMLAVQGPKARELATPVLVERCGVDGAALAALKRFHALDAPGLFATRTGYTGEDGLELCVPGDLAEPIWEGLLAAGVRPCGLAARDVLRLEAGLNLHGTDMDEGTLPGEVGLQWLVDASDPERDFNGRTAVTAPAEALARCRAGLVLVEKGVPRTGFPVRAADGCAGEVTSGTFSPTLGHGVALVRMACSPARLEAALPQAGSVEIRGREVAATLLVPPFVRNGRSALEPGPDAPTGALTN